MLALLINQISRDLRRHEAALEALSTLVKQRTTILVAVACLSGCSQPAGNIEKPTNPPVASNARPASAVEGTPAPVAVWEEGAAQIGINFKVSLDIERQMGVVGNGGPRDRKAYERAAAMLGALKEVEKGGFDEARVARALRGASGVLTGATNGQDAYAQAMDLATHSYLVTMDDVLARGISRAPARERLRAILARSISSGTPSDTGAYNSQTTPPRKL